MNPRTTRLREAIDKSNEMFSDGFAEITGHSYEKHLCDCIDAATQHLALLERYTEAQIEGLVSGTHEIKELPKENEWMFDEKRAVLGMAFFDRGEGINWIYLKSDEGRAHFVSLDGVSYNSESFEYARGWLERNPKHDKPHNSATGGEDDKP